MAYLYPDVGTVMLTSTGSVPYSHGLGDSHWTVHRETDPATRYRSPRRFRLAWTMRQSGLHSMRNRLSALILGVTAVLAASRGYVSGQQQVTITPAGIGPDPMGALDDACGIDRGELDIRVVARNPAVTGLVAKSVPGGWLVVDQGPRHDVVEGQDIVLVDEQLQEVTRWRPGSNRRWEAPEVIGMMPTGEVVAIEESALLVPGRPGLHPVTGEPTDAVSSGPNSVLYGSGEGIFELDMSRRTTVHRWSLEDFGMPWDREHGLAPKFLLRAQEDGTAYVAWKVQSSIWAIGSEAGPRLRVQRCVPEPLLYTHVDAPEVDFGTLGKTKVSISSIADFIVLESGGIIVLGALSVGDNFHRSIELYDADGSLKQAWELPIRRAGARFAYRDPRRLLLFRDGTEDQHLVLLHVEAEGYPSR